ncbi:MAG TPA: DUF4359 domain-containing protein [Candidatus Obscuribacterales bacterium]
MKLSTLLSLALLALAIAGLVITNPGPESYAQYASAQARTYFSEEVCDDLPPGLGSLLTEQCVDLVQQLQPQLEALMRDRTERLNLGVASLYRTSFGLPEIPLLPVYRAETLGIVKRFFTYRLERVS